jgi:hypothetical protein
VGWANALLVVTIIAVVTTLATMTAIRQ